MTSWLITIFGSLPVKNYRCFRAFWNTRAKIERNCWIKYFIIYASHVRLYWLITRQELSLLCCHRFRYKLNWTFRIIAIIIDLGLGLYYFVIFNKALKKELENDNGCCTGVLSFFVSFFFALSILIGLCLTCVESCSVIPRQRYRRSDFSYSRCCCSLYIILNQTWDQSSVIDIEPTEISNQIANQNENKIST